MRDSKVPIGWKIHKRAQTAPKHDPHVSQESALAHTGIVTGGTEGAGILVA